MLEARELLCERDERTLFSGLSFTLNAGEWVQITGSNGAGKTTLLRLLTGLSRPDAGDVLWQGQPLHQVRDSYHQNLLWIGHQPGIKTRLTALENLHFYHRDGDTAQCLEALAQAGLAGFEDIPVNQLSAGQQRRVALARLWLTRATLWILDEPFTAIDVNGVDRLTQRMAQHTEQGGIVILTTHQPLNVAESKNRRETGAGVSVLMSDQQQPPVYKIALGIEYDGSRYYGWQRQNEVRSVQEKLEKALSQVANEPITVFCAGRTDAGVHGTGQVVHFETTAQRKDAAWTLGVNANLPGDIAVRWVKAVPDDFHARFSATARRYRYIIYNHRLRPAVLSKGVTHFYEPLDAERMHRAAQCLLGENDFTSFRAVQCQSRTPWRNVMHINVTRHGPYVVVDIKANAFVHHMVRNIVGSLMEVGAHNQPESWIAELLAAKDRTLAAATAKAEGLYLVAVDYPDRYDLPKPPMGPLFLAD